MSGPLQPIEIFLQSSFKINQIEVVIRIIEVENIRIEVVEVDITINLIQSLNEEHRNHIKKKKK